MYILPMLTHLEVVALGDRSDISPDQHLNYASIQGTHVCPPPCAQMAGHKAILWQPRLVDRAKGPCPL